MILQTKRIYINLVRRLSVAGFNQVVYVPVRWENKIDGNRDDAIPNVEYHYSYILKRNIFFKLRFHRKLRIILNDLESKINVKEVGLVHAHFLFSDGGVAYELKKKHKIPYVVSVRATDIHYFFRMMIHLRKFGNEIMKNAERVIFINHSYREIFKKKYLNSSFTEILDKSIIIPNAVDDRWFNNEPEKKIIKKEIRLLYVGRIIKRKKLDIVIKAVKALNKLEKSEYVLEVVGDGEYMEQTKKIADDKIIFHGKITDFKTVKNIYERCHIFVMPALKETFGLVYIEALSQALPIIYCKGEGVDGFFHEKEVGASVAPNNVMDVKESILDICANYQEISLRAISASKKFNWDEITAKYAEAYKGLR